MINTLSLEERIYLVTQKKDPYAGFEKVDLLLMGSHYEGFPNVLVEAGARGIPVIAFDAPGGIREIVIDGENGLLVLENESASFAAVVEKGVQMKFNRNRIIESTLIRFPLNAAMIRLEDIFIQYRNQFQAGA